MRGNRGKLLAALGALAVLAAAVLAVWAATSGHTGGETAEHTCTVSVSCAVLLERPEALERLKRQLVPEDGFLLPPTEVAFEAGESAFDVLYRALRERKIHLEFSETPVYGSVYIEGIGNLYEMDGGPLSGWTYTVNGSMPGYGCSQWILEDGDKVEFLYILDGGEDIGVSRGEGEQ